MLVPDFSKQKLKAFDDYLAARIKEMNLNMPDDIWSVTYRIEWAKRHELIKLSQILFNLMEKDVYPDEPYLIAETKQILYVLRGNLNNKLKSRDNFLYGSECEEEKKIEILKGVNRTINRYKKLIRFHKKNLNELLKAEAQRSAGGAVEEDSE
jgi:hypothetical protein